MRQVNPAEEEPTMLSTVNVQTRGRRLPPVEVEQRMRVQPSFETPMHNETNAALNSQESQLTNILELLRKDIKMNLVTIMLLISFLPRQVALLGQYQPCYLEGCCDQLRDSMRWYFLLTGCHTGLDPRIQDPNHIAFS